MPAEELTFDEVRIGHSVSVEKTFSAEDLDTFGALSGDRNPLHGSAEFAQKRAYPGRVVHGMLLGSLVSQIAGMHLPGRDCILQSIQLDFVRPAYAGDKILAVGDVSQVQSALRTIVVRVRFLRGDELVARGKYVASFQV